MKYHELIVAKQKSNKRVGRGIAAGRGKTAGRGTKGQHARTGFRKRPGFEGGQNPLMQRLPKLHGFHSFKPQNEIIHTGQLDKLASKVVDTELLANKGLITSPFNIVKLITKGSITSKITVKLPAASASAIKQIQKAGGSFERVARSKRPSQTTIKPHKLDVPK